MARLLDGESSSPDPLAGDDYPQPPSTMRPMTRRSALPGSAVRSSAVRSSAFRSSALGSHSSLYQSPRKQIFELDVGNEREPQRLRVTVEAEEDEDEASRGVTRRLFPGNASPTESTRSVSRARERERTVTTTVPLKGDEGPSFLDSDAPTPRGRGRPRGRKNSLGTKNGTPGPRGRKRAGTPLAKGTQQRRKVAQDAASAELEGDAVQEADGNAVEAMPKPRGRPPKTKTPKKTTPKKTTPKKTTPKTKTPKKTTTPALPSNKPTTGKKRGRPRKMPSAEPISPENPEEPQGTTTADPEPEPAEPLTRQVQMSSDDGHDMYDGYMDMPESHGDVRSDSDGPEGTPYSVQDTLVHASDFSVIAVESLPSFQASFQASQSGMIYDPPSVDEAGEETNMLIGEALRRGGQGGSQAGPGREVAADQGEPSWEAAARDETPAVQPPQRSWQRKPSSKRKSSPAASYNSPKDLVEPSSPAWSSGPGGSSRSPRRQKPKPTPPNRQVFGNKAPNTSDSFSSVPGSVLAAVMPGTLPVEPTRAVDADGDTHMHDDEYSELPLAGPVHGTPLGKVVDMSNKFSNIPQSVLGAPASGRLPARPSSKDVLGAATPRARPGQPTSSDLREVGNSSPTAGREHGSTSRSANSYASSRLPTPDDTSSSDSRKDGDEGRIVEEGQAGVHGSSDANTQLMDEARAAARDSPAPNVPSSPTADDRSQQPTIEVEAASLLSDQVRAGTPSPPRSSPPLPPAAESPPNLAPAKSSSPEQRDLLQIPSSTRRPTLSPIVRVGRTLQNVMSDRSSPDGRESSLGSPFRGSGNNESRQSSVAKSPDGRHPTLAQPSHTNPRSSLSKPIASRAQNIRSHYSFDQSQQQAPAVRVGIGDIEGPSGSHVRDYAQAEPQRTDADGAAVPVVAGDGMEKDAVEQGSPETKARESRPSSANTAASATHMPRNPGLADVADDGGKYNAMWRDARLRHEAFGEAEQDGQDGQGQDASGGEAREDLVGSRPEEEDDSDIWDIEASRPSPETTQVFQFDPTSRRKSGIQWQIPRQPEVQAESRRQSEVSTNNNALFRRSKPLSPWRRNARRLIYQQETKSPAQIEVGESPQSETDELSLVPMAITAQQRPVTAGRAVNQVAGPDDDHMVDGRPGGDEVATFSTMGNEQLGDDQAAKPRGTDRRVADEVAHGEAQGKANNDTQQQAQEKMVPKKSIFGDIMSFFSSPAPPPRLDKHGYQVDSSATKPAVKSNSQPQPAPAVEKAPSEEPQSAPRIVSFFPHLPQKHSQPSPERRAELSRPAPLSLVPDPPGSDDTIPDPQASSSPPPPESRAFSTIPQKQNFSPFSDRSRNTASLFAPSREASPASPDRQLSPVQPEYGDDRWAGEGNVHDSSLVSNGTDYERVPPRPQPSRWDRTLSPVKSCMRSPLKPRTPGRAVEFTTHAAQGLSQPSTAAVEVAAAKRSFPPFNPVAEKQLVRPGPALLPPAVRPNGANGVKDNHHAYTSPTSDSGSGWSGNTDLSNPTDITKPTTTLAGSFRPSNGTKSMTAAAASFQPMKPKVWPMASSSAALATTDKPTQHQPTWTYAHWVRLEELLRLRRYDPPAFQRRFATLRRCPSADAILGKEISAEGEQLTLEPWHLDVVGAFRRDGDGDGASWDEKVLARRLFALIVGSEHRRAGLVTSRSSGQEQTGAAA